MILKELLYLYCVTKDKPASRGLEALGVKICPVFFSGMCAVLSRVSPDDFSEESLKKHLADMGWVERNIRLHEKVIEAVMKDQAVLPFKFGTVFESDANVGKLLRENGAEFKATLERLEGQEEWGLKIYCEGECLEGALCGKNERILAMDREIASSSLGKAYLLKKKREEIIKDITNEKISEYTRDCFESLRAASGDTRINKLLPQEVTEKKEAMVLNAAFLISSKRIQEFEAILARLKTDYAGQGLIFDCTGPWPPYNFCDLLRKQVGHG